MARKSSITESAEPRDRRSSAAVAHDGRVTAVQASPDGLYWLTAATDSRVRLWESATFRSVSSPPASHKPLLECSHLLDSI